MKEAYQGIKLVNYLVVIFIVYLTFINKVHDTTSRIKYVCIYILNITYDLIFVR